VIHDEEVPEVRALDILLVKGCSEKLQDGRITGCALQKINYSVSGCIIQENYNLVPAPSMPLVTWTSSKTKPWSSLLVERVVRLSSVGFGRSMRLDRPSNFAPNRAEGLRFGKPREGRFIGGEWAEVWGHFNTGKLGTSKYICTSVT